MPIYSYKATDPAGKIVEGAMEAPEEKAVARNLQNMGYIPIRIGRPEEETRRFDIDISKRMTFIFNRISTKDVMFFTQDLSSLLGAGLVLDRALSTLIDVTENIRLKEVIRDVLKNVQEGSDLSQALGRHTKVFSRLYVNMVRAGEAGGVLEAVLVRLGAFLETSQDLRDYIKSAMVYPLFLVFVGGISIIILLTFVIPKFSIIFSDMGQAIPLSTQFLLGFSEVLKNYWWAMLGGLAGLYFLFRQYMRTSAGRMRLDKYKLNFPLAGDLLRKIEVARFARTLGTLIRSGVPILPALNLSKEIIANEVIARSMGRVYDRIKQGGKLSGPLGETGVFPPLAVEMVTVGEETGRLDEMLLRVADIYDKTVRNTTKRLISLLEPAMILVMGLVVGFIVVSMLMAIFSVNEIPF